MLYKKFKCNNLDQINQEILNHLEKLDLNSGVFWNPISVVDLIRAAPLLKSWLNENNLLIKSVAVTKGNHADCCPVHTDTPPSIYKLSWPVLNTELTWNRWFSANKNATVELNHLGGTVYRYEDLTEIDRMQVDSPAIIATGVPHDVWCEPEAKFPRIGLQCQLFKEPQSL